MKENPQNPAVVKFYQGFALHECLRLYEYERDWCHCDSTLWDASNESSVPDSTKRSAETQDQEVVSSTLYSCLYLHICLHLFFCCCPCVLVVLSVCVISLDHLLSLIVLFCLQHQRVCNGAMEAMCYLQG